MRYLEPYTDILIVGCGTCATEVQTGGEKQVEEMANKFRGRWFVVCAKMLIASSTILFISVFAMLSNSRTTFHTSPGSDIFKRLFRRLLTVIKDIAFIE